MKLDLINDNKSTILKNDWSKDSPNLSFSLQTHTTPSSRPNVQEISRFLHFPKFREGEKKSRSASADPAKAFAMQGFTDVTHSTKAHTLTQSVQKLNKN